MELISFSDLLKLIPPTGHILELGVAHGGTFRIICACAYPRRVYGFDWFRGLPEDWVGQYIKGALDRHGVPPYKTENGEYIVGLVEDTLGPWLKGHQGEVAFCHFDLDLYKPTALALKLMQDRFVTGSILLFDEYDESLPGHDHEQQAFAEFLHYSGWQAEFIGKRTAYAHAYRLTEHDPPVER